MEVNVTKKPKATLEIAIKVPNVEVKKSYDEMFMDLVKNTELKGFRKGQAPKEMVKEKMDVSKLYGELINTLLQKYYPQALKENHILPIANPKVEIKEFDLEKDFEFTATVATRPEIELGDYKTEIKKVVEKRNAEIKALNAERLKNGEELGETHVHTTADDVITGIVNVTKMELADLVVDDEADRMMSRLVDQAQTIGLSLEQYLKSHNKNAEDLRKEYRQIAERNLKAEFALSELTQVEKIEITDEEINAMIEASGDAQAKEMLNDVEQKLYIRSILIKNKLITNIINDVEGGHDDK